MLSVSDALLRNMTLSSWKRYRTSVIVSFFLLLFLVTRYYDEEVFNGVIYLHAHWKETYNVFKSSGDLRGFHLPQDQSTKKKTIILIWSPAFGYVDLFKTSDDDCVITYDRSAMPKAKAVVFHFADIHESPRWLPRRQRTESQRWIWWCREPPWNTRYVFRKYLTKLNGVFNWTMTYRLDSDVHYPYPIASEIDLAQNRTVKEMIAGKTATALGAWIVSNCKPTARRQVIDELQKFIKIDVWGKCTNKPLCGGQCAFDTISRYKFYFSLENSRCKDYITEKFTVNGLQGGAVPVVFGTTRSDYEKIAPPNSFIHVDDFENLQELAKYLQNLDKDDQKYGEYLRWRSIPDSAKTYVRKEIHSGWDNLCKKLKESEDTVKSTVSSLDKWWFGHDYVPAASTFSVCHPEDGPSGTSLHGYLVAAYTIAIFMCCLASIRPCSFRRGKNIPL